jgi:hypothetical protein
MESEGEQVMTAQELFDKVATHLLTQGKKCAFIDSCRYRHLGLSCAAGCLLNNEQYENVIEGLGINDSHNESVFREIVGDDNFFLLRQLQCIHDNISEKHWKDRLADLAIQYGLKMPTVEVSK